MADRPKAAPDPAAKGAADPARAARLFGVHAVRAAWLNPARHCRRLLVAETALAPLATTLAAAKDAGLLRPEPELSDRRALERLLPDGAVHQGVVLECQPLPDPGLDAVLRGLTAEASCLVLLLDQITDPHNVGAILRSAAAFGATAVVMTDRHAPAVTGTLARSASGAVDLVPIIRVVNLSRALRYLIARDFLTIGLSEDAPLALDGIARVPRTALVVGAEGSGLRRLTRETCQALARLPTAGALATLNASNAAAVALYELTARRRPSS